MGVNRWAVGCCLCGPVNPCREPGHTLWLERKQGLSWFKVCVLTYDSGLDSWLGTESYNIPIGYATCAAYPAGSFSNNIPGTYWWAFKRRSAVDYWLHRSVCWCSHLLFFAGHAGDGVCSQPWIATPQYAHLLAAPCWLGPNGSGVPGHATRAWPMFCTQGKYVAQNASGTFTKIPGAVVICALVPDETIPEYRTSNV